MKCTSTISNTSDKSAKKSQDFNIFKKTKKNLNFKEIDVVKEFCKKNKKFENDIEIISYLDSGSSGVVYQGRIKNISNKNVALKFLTSNKIVGLKRDKITNREIQIMQKLKNIKITNLFGVYEINNILCMVMEFARYGDIISFQKLIQKPVLNETLLAFITRQILIALFHCKNCNVIHLDVKQQNILIDENLTVKLSDFSHSIETNKSENEKITLPLVGTSIYIAPEILGKKEIYMNEINKVDTYSLGVLLYKLAFNTFPYDIQINEKVNFDAIYQKLSSNNLSIPKNKKHSDLLRDFLNRLLIKDISLRLSVEDALEHPWIKGALLIFEEKEKIGDLEKFLINLVTDNVRTFNEFVFSKNASETIIVDL